MSIPELNEKRANASACTYTSKPTNDKISNLIYGYGGSVSDQKDLNTIECIGISQFLNRNINFIPKKWTTIQLKKLTPRRNALLCPFKNDEIIIYGGHNMDEDCCQSNGVIINMK